jgi:hypothetical protein
MFTLKTRNPDRHSLAYGYQDGVVESILPDIEELEITDIDRDPYSVSFEFKHFTTLKHLVVPANALRGSCCRMLNPSWTLPYSSKSLTISARGTRREYDDLFEFLDKFSKDRHRFPELRRVQLSTDVMTDETRFIYMSDLKEGMMYRLGVRFEASPQQFALMRKLQDAGITGYIM